MYRHVLLAYDGSPPARAALTEALRLLKGQPTMLSLAYVMSDLPFDVELSAGSVLDASRQAQRTAAERLLHHARDQATLAEVDSQPVVLESAGRRVAEVLVEHARRLHAGLVIVGSHGRHGVSRALLGSDAELVARLSPIPVLIVKANEAG